MNDRDFLTDPATLVVGLIVGVMAAVIIALLCWELVDMLM